jgi:hypothetical protein
MTDKQDLINFARDRAGRTVDALIDVFESPHVATETMLQVVVERMEEMAGTAQTVKKLRDVAAELEMRGG